MFVVFLKFGKNKEKAKEFMEGHNQWLRKGIEEDVFMLAGSLSPQAGGGLLAYNTSFGELESRVQKDPFVEQGVVDYEIIEIRPSVTNEKLNFLKDK